MFAEAKRVVCLGGATVDRKYHALQPLQPGTSNPVRSRRSFGGVARNVAETLGRLGVPSSLVSVVGDDENGRSLAAHLQASGVDITRLLTVDGHATAEYAAVLGPDNDLSLGIADMAILDTLTVADIQRVWPLLASASWVFVDCNLSREVLSWLIGRRRTSRFRLAADAVSSVKVTRLDDLLQGIDLLFCNVQEAEALLGGDAGQASAAPKTAAPKAGPRELALRLRSAGAAAVVLSRGDAGLVLAEPHSITELPAVKAKVVDVTGAGDALIAGTLSRLIDGESLMAACRIGMLAAALTIETEDSVNLSMSPRLVESSLDRLTGLQAADPAA